MPKKVQEKAVPKQLLVMAPKGQSSIRVKFKSTVALREIWRMHMASVDLVQLPTTRATKTMPSRLFQPPSSLESPQAEEQTQSSVVVSHSKRFRLSNRFQGLIMPISVFWITLQLLQALLGSKLTQKLLFFLVLHKINEIIWAMYKTPILQMECSHLVEIGKRWPIRHPQDETKGVVQPRSLQARELPNLPTRWIASIWREEPVPALEFNHLKWRQGLILT